MIHMIEGNSSFLQTSPRLSMTSGKRARSPEVDNYENRPPKRPSLAIDAFNKRQLCRSSAGSSRQGSEDWVQRAGGLTIDSPIYTPGDLQNHFLLQAAEVEGSLNGGEAEGDVDMVMDSEDLGGNMGEPGRPQLVPFHTLSLEPHFVGESYPQQQQQHQGEPHLQHRHPYATRYSERIQSTMMPLINVVEATPIEDIHSSQQRYLDHAPATIDTSASLAHSMSDSGNTATFAPVPMALSPSTSFSQSVNPPKRNIAFGPRANCEKCRLGVPGHFIHLDYQQ